MKILRYLAVAVMVSSVAFGACTSSNSPTNNNISTNTNYDSQYRDQTRSAANNPGQQLTDEGELGDPPITIMEMSTETGDIYPGEDYFVYGVIDNPDGRDLEYEWSLANGDFYPVAEADRGRLATVVEDAYNTAQPAAPELPAGDASGGAFTEQPLADGGAAVPPGAQAPTGSGGQPAAGQVPAAGGAPAAQPKLNAAGVPDGQSADTPPGQNNNTQPDLMSNTGGSGAGTGSSGTNDQTVRDQTPVDKGVEKQPYNPKDFTPITYNEYTYDGKPLELIIPLGVTWYPNLNDFDPYVVAALEKIKNREPLEQDELISVVGVDKSLRDWSELVDLGKRQTDGTSDQSGLGDGYILQYLRVAGQNVQDAVAQRQETQESEVAGNIVDQSIDNATAMLEDQLGTEFAEPAQDSSSGRLYDSNNLRSEYENWHDEEGNPRKRSLGGYGVEYDDEEPLSSEESYERYTVITDEPYIEWTPRRPGRVNIWVRAMYHGEYVTDPRNLEVEVRLRDPEVELVKDFPDVVREDENVYVRVDGSNLPDFGKGLFTLSYDNTKLSFRDAELGEFFDDYGDASIYYAQPDKDVGRVLLAVDSNTIVSEPSGDGPLVYVKFKAKESLEDVDETQLAMVMDTSARYILNKDGANVLPLPLNLPPWRTELIMPPDLPNYERKNTPGLEAGSTPGGNRTPPGSQLPTQSGSNQTTNPAVGGNNPNGSFSSSTGFLSGNQNVIPGSQTPSTNNNSTPPAQNPNPNTTPPATTPDPNSNPDGIGGESPDATAPGRIPRSAEDDEEKENAKPSEDGDNTEGTSTEPAEDPATDEPATDPEEPVKKEEPKKDE